MKSYDPGLEQDTGNTLLATTEVSVHAKANCSNSYNFKL